MRKSGALWLSGILAVGLGAAEADAQTADLCAEALPYQADPGLVQRFRQQCSIQHLFDSLRESEVRRIADETAASEEAAHAKAQTEALTEERKKSADLAEYWKQWVDGDAARRLEEDQKKAKLTSEAIEAAKRIKVLQDALDGENRKSAACLKPGK